MQTNPVTPPEPHPEPETEAVPPVAPTPPQPKVDLLALFCEEIKTMEGWSVDSNSWHCNNPGNLRCTPGQPNTWNALAKGQKNGFCTFQDPATGMQALRNVTISCAKGISPTYNKAAKQLGLGNSGELNLYQYFAIRDPATDRNQPNLLAERFGRVLNVEPAQFKMRQLL